MAIGSILTNLTIMAANVICVERDGSLLKDDYPMTDDKPTGLTDEDLLSAYGAGTSPDHLIIKLRRVEALVRKDADDALLEATEGWMQEVENARKDERGD